MNTIILTGGGTAGHIAPNIALLPYLKDWEVHYCGEKGGMEERMIADYPQVTFHALPCIKFRRALSPSNLKVPFVLMSGISAAKKLIKEIQPRVVFGKGGYASLPATMAATKKGVPLIIHESDLSMGLGNRLVAKKSRFVCTAFPTLASEYDNGVFTGTPIRRELYEGSGLKLSEKYEFKGRGKPHLLIFGGSQGALALNTAAESVLDALTDRFDVFHIAGKHAYEGAREGYRRAEFCSDMADCYAWADYIVCRAGAGTLAEVVALKKAALVIPLPKSNTSRGDQQQNAEYYREAGLVNVLDQSELDGKSLLVNIDKLVRDKQTLLSNIGRAPSPDGTRKIAELIKQFGV